MTTRNPRRQTKAFTLVELLIVIMIIVMLVAILFPALGAARRKSRAAASAAQLQAISTACDSYMIAFNSAPGYVSFFKAPNNPNSISNFRNRWSGNENLVLSLMGRAVPGTTGWDPGGYNATKLIPARVDLLAVGMGPMSLAGKAYGSFYAPKPNELVKMTGTYNAEENDFPELVALDTGMPLLYMRRAQQPSATVTMNANIGNTAAQTNNTCYLMSEIADTVMAPALTDQAGTIAPVDQQNNSLLSFNVTSANWVNNTAFILLNRQLSMLMTTPNVTQSGANVNVLPASYALISPGPDGIYFNKKTTGAITVLNTSNIASFDDIVLQR